MAGATIQTPTPGRLRRDDPAALAALGDDQLLDRFVAGDPAAFGVLVARHGPMVLGVCRNVLGAVHDAEDAFQATFLVLARNAAAIRDRRVVARWLHEVAYRVALRARVRAARRRQQEKEAAEMSAVAARSDDDPARGELGPVLHEEINRLPEDYRSAVVLCYLEGRTNEEAAALLHWPVGTVKGRLSRARDLLRARLTRRGLAPPAILLLLGRWTAGHGRAEVVPPALADATARASLSDADAAPEVYRLAEQVDLPGPAVGAARWLRAGVIAAALAALVGASFGIRAPAQELMTDVLRILDRTPSPSRHACDEPLLPAITPAATATSTRP